MDLEVISIEQQFYYNRGRRKTSEVMELNYQSYENGKMAYVYIGRMIACALALWETLTANYLVFDCDYACANQHIVFALHIKTKRI